MKLDTREDCLRELERVRTLIDKHTLAPCGHGCTITGWCEGCTRGFNDLVAWSVEFDDAA